MSTAITDLTRIGDGPVATVYTGHRNGAAVALKVFPKRFDKRTMSAFTKEQAKLGSVRRVTSILMADAVDELASGETALRMELCTQSLAGLVERVGPLAAADVIILGRAAAVALTAAHSAGVVHGGVAPDNVLFRTNGEPVLGDFGVTLRHAFTRDPLHAIEYLPPETLRNGTLNEATDLYGLGAVLHFALSGRSPHPGRLGEQPGERVLRILGEPVPAINRPDVPIGLSTLVARLLSTAPEHRPADAAQVADHLTSMLPNPPKAAPREDWDDFDTPTPAAITHRPAPPRQPAPEDDLDFDDFAVPPRLAPGRSPYARPQAGGERSPYARPLPPAPVAPGDGRSSLARPPVALGDSPLAGPPVTQPPVRASVPPPVASGESSFAGPPVASPVEADPQPAALADLPLAGPSVAETPVAESAPAGVGDSPFAGLTVVGSPGGPASPGVSQQVVEAGDAQVSSAPPAAQPPVGLPAVGLPAVPPAVDQSAGTVPRAPLPLAPPLTPVLPANGALRVDAPVTEAFPLPQLATVRFAASPGVERRPADLDLDDDGFGGFGDFGDSSRLGQAKVLAGPLAPPGQSPKRMIRYDLLAGVALLLALLALVPLLLLRGDPAEMATTPHVPSAGGSAAPAVKVELDPPTDLNTQVKLTWTASADFDFAVVIAGEGERRKWVLAERNHSMTVDVKPGVKYCFLVQATNGDQTYDSELVALRGATCTR
jgi:serine/threonine protein kinase